MDIVLTIPKRNYEKNNKLLGDILDGKCSMFWVMSKKPKDLDIGDRIHFVKHGRVEHSLSLFRMKEFALETDIVTGRTWSGRCILYMDDPQYHDRIIECRGFQGFRYKWWEE